MKPPARIRVLIADDHAVLRAGLRLLISAQGDMEVVGEVADGPGVVAALRRSRPDVVLMDLTMPGGGVKAIAQGVARFPAVSFLVLTMHDDPAYVRAALRAGASGYVPKTNAEELPDAIRAALRGKTYLPASLERQMQAKSNRQNDSPLSPREREILEWIAEGKAAKEIAGMAGVSVRTVEFHKYNIMNKLNLHSTAELTRYALQEGIAGTN